MMKSKMYYLRKFNSYEELEDAIIEYIDYYNNHRYQKRLKLYDTNGIQRIFAKFNSMKMTPTDI